LSLRNVPERPQAPTPLGPFLFSNRAVLGSVNLVSDTPKEISDCQDQIRDQENDEAAVNVWDIEMRVMNDQGDNGDNNRSDEGD